VCFDCERADRSYGALDVINAFSEYLCRIVAELYMLSSLTVRHGSIAYHVGSCRK